MASEMSRSAPPGRSLTRRSGEQRGNRHIHPLAQRIPDGDIQSRESIEIITGGIPPTALGVVEKVPQALRIGTGPTTDHLLAAGV